MITILSLLEGRTDNYVITRMIRAFNIAIFKENLHSIYLSYTELYGKKHYGNDIFNHFEKNSKYDPEPGAMNYQDVNTLYYVCIIETGFMIYHLMRYFQDNDDPENREIIADELPELV
jgi:hypothetical protein